MTKWLPIGHYPLPPLLIAIALLIATPLAVSAELSAREIVDRADNRDDGDRRSAQMEMVLIDRHGNRRERAIRSFDRDQGEDRQRIMFFLEPADVTDTAFLTYDYGGPKRDDDQWLYLPALHKSKRIASSDRSGAFMGSDFNYSDMTRRDLDAYQFRILKTDQVRGAPVWLIERVPTSEQEIAESGYTKSLLFIRQDNFVMVRAVHWSSEGSRIKYQDVTGLELIDGIWTITEMSMTSKRGRETEHRTELRWSDVRYNQPLAAEMFTVRQLEKGLP